jgi:uncharacterized protein (TIGR03000 family)
VKCFNWGNGASGTSAEEQAQIMLNIFVPEDAIVLLNGKPTETTGIERRIAISGIDLEYGKPYPYTIHAEIIRNGKVIAEDLTVNLYRGQAMHVSLLNAFQPPPEPEPEPLN